VIMQWHTGYFAANGGAIWMHWHATTWAVHDVWYCRLSRSVPRPAEVCVSPNTPTQVYQEGGDWYSDSPGLYFMFVSLPLTPKPFLSSPAAGGGCRAGGHGNKI